MTDSEREFFVKIVIAAMDELEEIGGPDGEDYIKAMHEIAREALERADQYQREFDLRVPVHDHPEARFDPTRCEACARERKERNKT